MKLLEAAALLQRLMRFEGELSEADRSFSQTQTLLQDALCDSDYCPHDGEDYCGCMVMDVFPKFFVFRVTGETYRLNYAIDDAGAVTFSGAPVEVIPTMTYPDAPEDPGDGSMMERRSIPAWVRDRMPETDFAGKNRTLPIQIPQDVRSAIRGSSRVTENHPKETLKANIIAIAKRKGEAFVAALPDSWRDPAPAPATESKKGKKKKAGEESLEEAELVTDPVPFTFSGELVEGELREATSMIKIISPGWGSSGYYSDKLLRSSAGVFKAGLQMFVDHPTAAEEAARPEGSINNLGATLLEDAQYRTDLDGPGLYARAKIFPKFAGDLKELKDSIGVSIRARGAAKMGEAEGRKGPIVERIDLARSVDFVAAAGRGGKVLDMIESRRASVANNNPTKETDNMTEAEIKALQEENARLREGAFMTQAKELALATLKPITMPALTRERLADRLKTQFTVKEGKIDEAAFKLLVEEAAKEEMSYLSQLTGSGTVKNLGESKKDDDAEEKGPDRGELAGVMQRLGNLSESGAKAAASF